MRLHRVLLVSMAVWMWTVGLALAAVPSPVSPGSAAEVTQEARCPTFSWGGVEGASAYELVVYRVGEDGAVMRRVVGRKIPGTATSWTPPMGACLAPGGRYAWTLRAIEEDEKEAGEWSRPNLFAVPQRPSEEELARALAIVREHLAAAEQGDDDDTRTGKSATSRPAGVSPGATASGPGRRGAGVTNTVIENTKVASPTLEGNLECMSCVDGSEIVNATITADDIAGATITAAEVAGNTLTHLEIAADAITASELADNAVDSNAIINNSVTGFDIKDLTINAIDIAADAIGGAEIAANAISSSELADNAVLTANILDGTITAADIGTGAVDTDEIATGAVGAAEIAASAVGGSELTALTGVNVECNGNCANVTAQQACDSAGGASKRPIAVTCDQVKDFAGSACGTGGLCSFIPLTGAVDMADFCDDVTGWDAVVICIAD